MGGIGCVRRFGSVRELVVRLVAVDSVPRRFFKGEVVEVDPVAVSEVGNGTVDSW